MRKLTAALLAWAISSTAWATTASTDYTDLWWIPNESGWGANVAQQGDILFVTLFVYDAQHEPTWFVAPMTKLVARATPTFQGPLYTTTGPPFRDPWNPALATNAQVGSLQFTPSTPSAATLVYDVGGIVVTKQVIRQTWGFDNLAGIYFGGREGVWSGCGAGDGKVDTTATVSASQTGADVQIRDAGPRHTCNYSGKYKQTGRMGEITGNAVCDDGITRFFFASEVQVAIQYFVMRVRMQQIGTDCVFNGYSGGIRQLP